MQISLNNNLSFQSKIKFVSSTEFERLPLEKMREAKEYVGYPWLINQAIIKERGYTDRVCSCNAGGIQNSQQLLLFHLLPDCHELDKIEKVLNEKIPELRSQNANLRGLIIGGDNFSGSILVFEKLKSIFEKFKIDTSIIWGQKVRGCRVFYSVKKDTWIVNSPKATTSYPQEVETLEDLKNNFEYIKISNQDKLCIGKTRIKNSDANQGL